jgi:hypothetical protein
MVAELKAGALLGHCCLIVSLGLFRQWPGVRRQCDAVCVLSSQSAWAGLGCSSECVCVVNLDRDLGAN